MLERVPNTFDKTLQKQNDILKKAGVSEDKLITTRKYIDDAIKEAFGNPILTAEKAKDYDPTMKDKIAE